MEIICNLVREHLMHCRSCRNLMYRAAISASTAKAGAVSSPAKAKSSRLNGLKGGRPRK